MLRYKLTDQNLQTHNGFQWLLGAKRTTSGEGELCGSGWLHCYSDPVLAFLLNPIHANIQNPRLFEVEGWWFLFRRYGTKRRLDRNDTNKGN